MGRTAVARLLYIANVSADGYTEDAEGDFGWSEPDDEVFAYITDLIRPVGTAIYGRRMYETMAVWETDPSFAAESELMADFAEAWMAADKLVYSTTLEEPVTERTRIERRLDADAVRDLKATSAQDLTVGGAVLAGEMVQAGLVDAIELLVGPVLLGGGKPALPDVGRVHLDLVHVRHFPSGTVSLRYDVRA